MKIALSREIVCVFHLMAIIGKDFINVFSIFFFFLEKGGGGGGVLQIGQGQCTK